MATTSPSRHRFDDVLAVLEAREADQRIPCHAGEDPDHRMFWTTCPVCDGPWLDIKDIDGLASIGCREGCPQSKVIEALGDLEPEAQRLDVMTARDLCDLPEPSSDDELAGPLLMRGSRLVLGGHTGEGKTTLALQLAAAIATGTEFLGWPTRQGRVLVIDAEQGLRTIQRRLREAGLDTTDRVDYLRAPDGLRLDTDGGDHTALEAVLAAGRYDLVLADPLYKLHGGDSNDERQAVDLMRRLDAWREQYGFALVLPVHCRKTPVGAKFGIQEFFGSTAYLRGAEVVIGLQRVRAGYSYLHWLKDRDGDLPIGERWGLQFDRDSGFRRDPDDGTTKLTAAEQVAELLRDQPEMSKAQLVEATGYAEKTIERALKDLGAEARRPGPQSEKLWSLDDEAGA